MTYVPNIAEDGEVKGYFGLMVDLTDRIQVERALQESELRLFQILNVADDAIISATVRPTISAAGRPYHSSAV